MQKFKLIIFDWDGTLYRSIDLIQGSIVVAGRELGADIDAATARSIIGLGLKAAQRQLFPDRGESDKEFYAAFHRAYRKHYEAGEAAIQLYDGAYEFVRDLHSRQNTIAIATAKSRAGINRSLDLTGLGEFVRHSRTPEECRPKPDPHMIEEILRESGFQAHEALMVGDTTHDLQMAINAGISHVGVSHGAHSEAELAALNPVRVCSGITELRRLLLA